MSPCYNVGLKGEPVFISLSGKGAYLLTVSLLPVKEGFDLHLRAVVVKPPYNCTVKLCALKVCYIDASSVSSNDYVPIVCFLSFFFILN